MGLVPAACDRVGRTTSGAAHDVRRDHGVSQCRGGLAPTASLIGGGDRSGGRGRGGAAVGGDGGVPAWPVLITACRCRRIAAARTVWAWVAALGCARGWSGGSSGRRRRGWLVALPRPRARRPAAARAGLAR